MRAKFIALLVLVLAALCATSCREKTAEVKPDPLLRAYDSEQDWNNPDRVIPLNYQQAQGKRVFYQYCVWCHADATPAGPSNRSNLSPMPPLANDGAVFNTLSDGFLRSTIALGGSAVGKSGLMPPWGRTLKPDEIDAVVAFFRAIAQPPYQSPARPGPKYSVR
ncbi:MAG TPA: cytochrome c [Terriglobia bacterium]|jgi:mono/diheme cytochrome c family protein|nr:cytochrome c [Terriglobia bacterium]